MAAREEESNEWEFVNDNGFVYKRKKRRLDPTAFARIQDPGPDPVAQQRERRKQKRKALLKLKEKYEREIGLWVHLSDTLKSMEEKTKLLPQQHVKQHFEVSNEGSQIQSAGKLEKRSGSLVTELLSQVETQEEIMRDFSHLCDIAESLCDAQEEKTKQSLLDLPVWASPRELMASLCED